MPPETEVAVDRGDDFIPPVDLTQIKPEELEKKAEPEAKAAPAPEPEKKKGDENLIPRERFNEAVQKERAKAEQAMRRAQELEETLATRQVSEDTEAAQKQLKDLIKSRNALLADGELDKAGEVDTKIFQLQDALSDHKADIRAFQAKEMAKEEVRYDTVVTKMEVEHPELDPDHESYDQETVDEVRALMRGYQAEQNLSPSAALSKAISRTFKANNAGLREEASVKKEAVASERKKEAVEKNISAAKRQPASIKEVGQDHDKLGGGLDAKTVMNMSFKEFSELSEDVLSRMRGDSL